jgi:tetratricopeptide (TPR) repeat protein
MTGADEERRYVAFISYSHVDRAAARWLHRRIETYRIPAQLLATPAPPDTALPRLSPIFIDREELPTSVDLAESVRAALQQSEFLIVVCSPDAARSHWVNEEVRLFKTMGRGANVLCLIVDGEPATQRRGLPLELECMPPALRFEVAADGRVTERPAAEPLAADIRRGQDSRHEATLKILAALLRVPLDRLRQRDVARRHRRLALVGAASTLGCVVLAGLSIAALLARNEAERQRQLAEQKSMTAQRTADFVVSLFKVSDPGEARGNTITAREILDRGARQIDDALRDEPAVRADLLTTLGEVYTGLGLYGPAFDLLSKARALPEGSPDADVREQVSLAELEFQRGNDARAEQLLAAAQRLLERDAVGDVKLRARLFLDRGDVAAVRHDDRAARGYYDDARQLAERHGLAEIGTRALEGLGLSSFYAGDMDAAQRWYDEALGARVRLSGETHPKVSETLTALGSIAYMRGEGTRAEQFWLHSLDVDRRVLGPNHPDLAATMVNLGRLRVERRDFENAVEILEEAVDIMAAQQSETHDSLVFGYTNLALAWIGLHDYAAAEPLLRKALRAATQTGHRLEGPILTDLADLDCRTGRAAQALAYLDSARRLVAERYEDEPWRTAHVDNVRAGCLAGLGRAAEAAPLVVSSTPVVLAKWPPPTFYGHDTLARAEQVYTSLGESQKAAEYRRMVSQQE